MPTDSIDGTKLIYWYYLCIL